MGSEHAKHSERRITEIIKIVLVYAMWDKTKPILKLKQSTPLMSSDLMAEVGVYRQVQTMCYK